MELCTTFRRKMWETVCINNWVTRGEETAHHSSLPIHSPTNDLPLSLTLSQKSLNTKKISEFLLWLSAHSLNWIESRGICATQRWHLEKKKKKKLLSLHFLFSLFCLLDNGDNKNRQNGSQLLKKTEVPQPTCLVPLKFLPTSKPKLESEINLCYW